MKTQLLLSFGIMLFCWIETSAQEPTKGTLPSSSSSSSVAPTIPVPEKIKIVVEESKEKMSQGVNNCLKVYIPEAQKDDVDKDLVKYMKNYNVKGDSRKSEYFYDNAEIKAFGNSLVDVYSVTEQKAGGVELEVFFDLGSSYLNSSDHPDKYKAAEDLIKKFARDEAAAAVGLQVVAAQKVMDSKNKELENFVKQDSLLSRKIRESQAIIKQAEADQQLNRTNQDGKKKEIEDQQKTIDAMKATQAGVE